MDFQQLKQALEKNKKIPNLLVFTGDEREVQLQYIKRIDPKAYRVEQVEKLPELMSFGNLLRKKKTFTLVDNKDALTLSRDTLDNLTRTNRLIIVIKDIDKRSSFYKENKDITVAFNRFTPEQLVGYIQAKIDISEQLAFGLAILCNNEISRIDNEIDKLKMLGETITEDLLMGLIAPPLEDAIFEMIDGVAKGDTERTFEILEDMLEANESPIKIVSLLYTKFKQVFLVQSMQDLDNKEIAGRSGLTFWQVKMTRGVCNQFDFETLVDILKEVQAFEHRMKVGVIDQKVGIVGLISKILLMG